MTAPSDSVAPSNAASVPTGRREPEEGSGQRDSGLIDEEWIHEYVDPWLSRLNKNQARAIVGGAAATVVIIWLIVPWFQTLTDVPEVVEAVEGVEDGPVTAHQVYRSDPVALIMGLIVPLAVGAAAVEGERFLSGWKGWLLPACFAPIGTAAFYGWGSRPETVVIDDSVHSVVGTSVGPVLIFVTGIAMVLGAGALIRAERSEEGA